MLTHPPRGPLDVEHHRFVHEPVEDGTGHHRVAEHVAPGGQAPVGRDQRGMAVLVAGVDHVEEHPGPLGVDGKEPHVVDDQDRRCGESPELGGEVPLPTGLEEDPHHGVRRREVAPVAGLDRFGGQRHGQVGLAAPGLAQEHDGPVLLDEAQAGQVLDQFAVDRRLELEVEVGHAAHVGEAGVTQSSGEPTVGGGGHLFGHHRGQVLDVAPVLVLGPLRDRGEALRRPPELQVAEVVLQLLVGGRGGHGFPPTAP